MDALVIEAEPRPRIGKGLNALRRQGLTPFALYGKTVQPRALQTNAKALERVVQAAGLSHLVEVRIGTEKIRVLLREIQRHPVAHHVLHVDAYALQMDEKQTLQIPIETVNQLSSSIPGDLILMQNLDAITVETFPDRIPDAIQVDLSRLTMERNILIGDLDALADVAFLHAPDEVVFSLARSAAHDAQLSEDEVDSGEGTAEEAAAQAAEAG